MARWLAGQASETLFTTFICQDEILAGIGILPQGRRRSDLDLSARAVFLDDFEGRVLSFDADAAVVYADMVATHRKAARSGATRDLMIAAIVRAQGTSVVARDVHGFEGCGLNLGHNVARVRPVRRVKGPALRTNAISSRACDMLLLPTWILDRSPMGRYHTIAFAALLLIALHHPAIAADQASIAGEYACASGCRLTDASPSIEIDGSIAHCMNELGGTYQGRMLSETSIYCFNKTGQLSDDGRSIVWSNGAIWTRNAPATAR